MTFLNIAFPATSALPVAEVAISALVAAARPLIGLSILTTMLLVFKPLITGMLRALKLAVFPNKTREEKSACAICAACWLFAISPMNSTALRLTWPLSCAHLRLAVNQQFCNAT
jgi:hypothetical protein